MPAKSKQQQKFMGMVHALNKGDIKPSDVSKSVKDVAKNIKKSDAEDFASTKHSGLPRKVKEQILNAFKEYANKMSGNKLGGGGSHDYAPQKGLRDDDGYEGSVNEILFIVDKFDKKKQDYGKVYYQDGGKRPGDGDLKKANKELERLSKKHKGLTLVSVGRNSKMYDVHNPRESVNEISYKVAGRPVTLIKGKKSNGTDWKVKFQNGKETSLSDVLSLIKPFPKGIKESVNEGMFSTIDQIKQDSKDVRDFVKNVFKDRDFIKMKNDKEFIKYLKSIYESKGVPQNYMQGRTSDYHTALRGKNRDYSGGTNFKKNNHGQPDIEKDNEDQETNQLSVQQSKLKEAKYYNKADALTAYFKGKINAKELDSIARKQFKTGIATKKELSNFLSNGFTQDVMSDTYGIPKGTLVKRVRGLMKFTESINEVKVETERYFGKKGIIIMIRDGNKLISAIFKDKKNADKFNRNKPADVKKLYQLAQKTKFPKTIDEYGQRLDLSFIDDKEARLKGTPEPKDAIDRDIEEYSGGSYEYTKGDQYGQNSVNEIGIFPIQNYVKGIIPSNFIDSTTRDKKERLRSTLRDLKNTLNHFWKQHKIPYRVK